MKKRISLLLGLGIASLALAAAAVAGTITATATVSGAGSMSLTHGASATMTDTLDGTDQSVNWSVPLTVTDARGTGAGWNLTVTSTSFSDGSGHTLAAGSSALSGVTVACVSGGTCSTPTNSLTYPLTLPAGATAPTAVKFFSSAATSGMGRFTLTPTVNVTIPGNAYAGSYSSTVTFAAVSGP